MKKLFICSHNQTWNWESFICFFVYVYILTLKYILSRSKQTTNIVKYLKYIQDSYIQDWVLDMINKLQDYFKRYKLGKAEVGAKGPH